jgi:AhpD family alkylhydroperoxidase
MKMTQRLNYSTVDPRALKPLYDIQAYLAKSSLEPAIRYFVTLRASQINGCAFCIALHNRELAEIGETGDRVWGLPAWREASWYSERERAALEWTEALTLVANGHPSDELYAQVSRQFNEREMVALSLLISVINTWNRFSIGFGTPPETADAVLAQLHHAMAP